MAKDYTKYNVEVADVWQMYCGFDPADYEMDVGFCTIDENWLQNKN